MRRTINHLALALLASSAAGCAHVDSGRAPVVAPVEEARTASLSTTAQAVAHVAFDAVGELFNEVVAADFVHTFSQLDGHSASDAEIRFSTDALADDPFLGTLERAMRARGYDVRITEGSPLPGDVVHDAAMSAGGGTRHTVVVNDVRLRRGYRTSPRGLPLATGPLFVLGADASGTEPDRGRTQPVVTAAAPAIEPVDTSSATFAAAAPLRSTPEAAEDLPTGTPMMATNRYTPDQFSIGGRD